MATIEKVNIAKGASTEADIAKKERERKAILEKNGEGFRKLCLNFGGPLSDSIVVMHRLVYGDTGGVKNK